MAVAVAVAEMTVGIVVVIVEGTVVGIVGIAIAEGWRMGEGY